MDKENETEKYPSPVFHPDYTDNSFALLVQLALIPSNPY